MKLAILKNLKASETLVNVDKKAGKIIYVFAVAAVFVEFVDVIHIVVEWVFVASVVIVVVAFVLDYYL